MAHRGVDKCWRREVGYTSLQHPCKGSELINGTGSRAVVQVFEGTTGIDVKKVYISALPIASKPI
jgi:vacuolar-type H+-ATPase catalytic subunit A/Vma1